ncbi:MAG: DUF429 domain-containing protein [Terriglobia bacterium]
MSWPTTAPHEVVCIGIDLAWSYRNATGLAALHLYPASARMEFVESRMVQTNEEILAWVERHRQATTVVGIDAPIIAPNPAGIGRPCDGEVTSAFGRYHAGTYPANREKCRRPIKLRRQLRHRGFNPDPESAPRQRGCWQVEVFPHPAQIVLFNLPRILKYKKGRVEQRRKGLKQLAAHIRRDLTRLRPRLRSSDSLQQLCAVNSSLRGQALKHREDQLDALLCAYIAGHFWFWGDKRWRIFGNVRSGCIVCPEIR